MTVLDEVVGDNYGELEERELHEALHAVLKTIVMLAAPVDCRSLSHLAEISYD